MNLEEFLDALSKTPRDWRLDGPNIRRGKIGCNCPITATYLLLRNDSAEISQFRTVAAEIGLDERLAEKIADAADYDDAAPWAKPDRKLRARLLEACGLE